MDNISSKGIILKLKIIPCASSDKIVGYLQDAIKIKVMATPEGGRANKSIIKLLADELNIAEKMIKIIKGNMDRNKLVFISGLSKEEITSRLGLN